jgi:hypothetical protein
LDKIMTPTEKEDARKLSAGIMADLKNLPPVIALRRDR